MIRIKNIISSVLAASMAFICIAGISTTSLALAVGETYGVGDTISFTPNDYFCPYDYDYDHLTGDGAWPYAYLEATDVTIVSFEFVPEETVDDGGQQFTINSHYVVYDQNGDDVFAVGSEDIGSDVALRIACGSGTEQDIFRFEIVQASSPEPEPEPEPDPVATVSMYRLYNPNSGEHFYTASAGERNHLIGLGWNDEGIGWTAPARSNTPVYRLYNPNGGEHHYTTSEPERNNLISLGWNDEGIGWYSDDARTVPLYRQYNPNAFANNHNYTTSLAENDHLVSIGWQPEGIGWYGV